VIFADVCDELLLIPADDYSCSIDGEFAAEISDDENIILKALQLLATECGVLDKYTVRLTKNIPVAAGLGGGSADAAAILRMVGEIHSLHMDKLMHIAGKLGADVPMCLKQKSAFVAGIGDEFAGFPELPQLHMVLANPRTPVATQAIYNAYRSSNKDFSAPIYIWPEKFYSAVDLCRFLQKRDNVLMEEAIQIAPVISSCLQYMAEQPDCLLARMSGSGATCFGIFTDSVAAQNACNNLKQQHPDYWVRSCQSMKFYNLC